MIEKHESFSFSFDNDDRDQSWTQIEARDGAEGGGRGMLSI